MTTSVTVNAHAGWPVKVTQKYLASEYGNATETIVVVAPNTEQTFYVHSGLDLEIHEVQKEEQHA